MIGLVFANWRSDHIAVAILVSTAVTTVLAWLLLRFGLLSLATCYAVSMSLTTLPLTLNGIRAWYGAQSMAAFALVSIVALAAFAIAIWPITPPRITSSR